MIFDIDYFWSLFPIVVKGLHTTLSMTILSFSFGLMIGIVIALIYKYKVKVLYPIAQLYVSFFRGSPVIAQMFFIYFGLPHIIPLFKGMDAFTAATLTISLNISSYMSETIRSSISAIDKGQLEAGLSVGMTNAQVLQKIVLPQAGRIALPSLSNNLIITLKGTAVAFTIGVTEIMGKTKIEASNSYRYFECYASVMVIYWIIVVAITYFQKKVEDRLDVAYK